MDEWAFDITKKEKRKRKCSSFGISMNQFFNISLTLWIEPYIDESSFSSFFYLFYFHKARKVVQINILEKEEDGKKKLEIEKNPCCEMAFWHSILVLLSGHFKSSALYCFIIWF